MTLRFFLLFLVGAVIGPLCDRFFHTDTGILAYTDPSHWIAWWTPLLFGGASLGISLFTLGADQWLKRKPRVLTGKDVAGGLLAFVLLYFVSGIWQDAGAEKSLVLFLAALLVWRQWDRTWQGLVTGALIALAGCLAEASLIAKGVFYYLAPDLLGIPAWLGFLYFSAAVGVGNLARVLVRSRQVAYTA